MYDIISAFQCYTISVDVYFPFHCTLWMAYFTFLLILCYCYCAHDNDVSHTLHREWGVTAGHCPTKSPKTRGHRGLTIAPPPSSLAHETSCVPRRQDNVSVPENSD